MIRNILLLAIITTLIIGCDQPHPSDGTTQSRRPKDLNARGDTSFSRFIPMDSANKMIGSYLNSINFATNDTDLRALMIDMDQLRLYTDSFGNQNRITHLKLFFAHTLEYINAGHANQFAGYKSGALTLVVAGYDTSGNYVYYSMNQVLEYCEPCPNSCPPGQAGNNLLTH